MLYNVMLCHVIIDRKREILERERGRIIHIVVSQSPPLTMVASSREANSVSFAYRLY